MAKYAEQTPIVTAERSYFNIVHASENTATTPSWIEGRLRSGELPNRWIENHRVMLRRDLDALMMRLPEETGLYDAPAFARKERSRKGESRG
jgi:hypothetical protein